MPRHFKRGARRMRPLASNIGSRTNGNRVSISDLGVNLLASLIFFLLGWATQRLWTESKRRGVVRLFWPLRPSGQLTVFVGRGPDDAYNDFTIYEGDAV